MIKLYKWHGYLDAIGVEVPILRHPDVVLVDCEIKSHEVKGKEPLAISLIVGGGTDEG